MMREKSSENNLNMFNLMNLRSCTLTFNCSIRGQIFQLDLQFGDLELEGLT